MPATAMGRGTERVQHVIDTQTDCTVLDITEDRPRFRLPKTDPALCRPASIEITRSDGIQHRFALENQGG
jgi:hypothetical protein